ncbi:uncharacterized protein LOC135371596 isoform X3 [Ornithodoros turicata]|uniref:uncharacterized protein LOC135371596 isoform X3 n=1 Tax=Ornithodoros turicata TaxID=34597 RepID=UPI0031389B67
MQLSLEFRDQPVRVKSEPPDVACLPQQGQVHQQRSGVTAGTCEIKDEPREESLKEHAITEVKTEPYDAAILTGQDQMGRKCDSTSEGVTAGTCHVKEEPREESSNGHPIVEVITEPYNVPLLTEQDQMGHSCDSTSEDARESTGTLHIKDQPRGTCDQEYLGCTSSRAQFKISTTTVELQPDSTALVTMDDQPAERHRDQSKPCALARVSKASLEFHMFAHCHNESEKCPTAPPTDVQMGEKGHERREATRAKAAQVSFQSTVQLIRKLQLKITGNTVLDIPNESVLLTHTAATTLHAYNTGPDITIHHKIRPCNPHNDPHLRING